MKFTQFSNMPRTSARLFAALALPASLMLSAESFAQTDTAQTDIPESIEQVSQTEASDERVQGRLLCDRSDRSDRLRVRVLHGRRACGRGLLQGLVATAVGGGRLSGDAGQARRRRDRGRRRSRRRRQPGGAHPPHS